MSELEINNVKNLLSNVSLINKKYEDLAEYTGENFNVFNILGVYSSELSHSNFIANLLNVKGKHGQKDVFLKLFLEEISKYFHDNESVQRLTLDLFETDLSSAETEKHIGKVNYENAEGGFIDILINDGKSNIIIENKIWAGDQPKQLLCYNKQDTNAPIIYLTLNGSLPSLDSKGHLILYKDFICVSYAENIKRWLEQCIKEMVNKPLIRETLNQYLNLVKQLTNQSSNQNMETELLKLILKDEDKFEASKIFSKTLNSIDSKLNGKLTILSKISQEEKNILDSKIKDFGFYGFKLVPKFFWEFQLMNFQIITAKDNTIEEAIVIELKIIDFQIYNRIWCHNKELENKIKNNLLEQTDYNFYYDFDMTTDEIFHNVKIQIDKILKGSN